MFPQTELAAVEVLAVSKGSMVTVPPVVSTLPSALVATLQPAPAATRVRESHHHQVDYRLTPG